MGTIWGDHAIRIVVQWDLKYGSSMEESCQILPQRMVQYWGAFLCRGAWARVSYGGDYDRMSQMSGRLLVSLVLSKRPCIRLAGSYSTV